MINKTINEIDACCGCGVCSLVCKKNAIFSVEDSKGFTKYMINPSLCINCNACRSVCPLNKSNDRQESDSFYLYMTSDRDIYLKSSSGGVFDASAAYIFTKNKAVCFGVDYDQDMRPRYSCVESYDQIEPFHGSKYISVKSEPEIFERVRSYLLEGYYVLFTGSPCYINALLNYLVYNKINTEKLYTVDFVCHGAGSPSIWNRNIRAIERRTKKKVVDYRFRYKLSQKNHSFHTLVKLSDNTELLDKPFTKIYNNLYFRNTLMQEACYNCPYACKKRVSDISMGDNKGYVYSDQDEIDFTNASLVIVNTSKGKELLEHFKRLGYTKKINIETLIQPHLTTPIVRPTYYDKFWNEYNKFGYLYLAVKYGAYNPLSIYKLYKSGYLCRSLPAEKL